MKKRKIKKVIVFIFTMFFMMLLCYNFVEATNDVVGTSIVDVFVGNDDGNELPKSIVGMILSAIRIIAAGSAAIAITVMGINYMAAAPTERAEIKNQMIRFALGIILVVGATEVVSALQNVASKVKATGAGG